MDILNNAREIVRLFGLQTLATIVIAVSLAARATTQRRHPDFNF
jgi:hypothetical protein